MNDLLVRMARWPNRRWRTLAGAVSIVVGACSGGIVYRLAGPGAAGEATFVAILGVAFAGWAVLVIRLELRQRYDTREIRSLVNIRPITGRLPLDLGSWAANSVLADELVRVICRRRPQRVLECGSGWTTVLMAVCLEELGRGEVVALEHAQEFAEKTRELLKACGVTDRAEVCLAPLSDQDVEGEERLWYQSDVVQSLEGPFELLFVDGPPGRVAGLSRYPAVPLLCDRLSEECLVVLDDGFRDDEERIADAWGRQLGVEPVLEPWGRGFWVLDRTEAWTKSQGSYSRVGILSL